MNERIAQITRRLQAASPGPWTFNSYSAVASDPLIEKFEDVVERTYEDDPVVCWVPAEYGDTATGRHAADAEFIANAREDVEYLLNHIAEMERTMAEGCADESRGIPGKD